MGSTQVNQYLKERRKKMKTTARFRKKRIYQHFQKQKQQHFSDLQKVEEDHERRTSFYNQYFSNTGETKKESKQNKRQQPKQKQQDRKIQKLKGRKKKIIRKMMKQKNNRGQPKLKNYVQYAVTKLQQTIEKEKKNKMKRQG